MYPEGTRPLDPGLVSESKARKWARRWRIRWGARHGRIRVRDELPVEEAKAKARHSFTENETTVTENETKMGTPGGPILKP